MNRSGFRFRHRCRAVVNINVDNQQHLGIETIRLIGFDFQSNGNVCNDENVIESWNLENSLRNLTIHIYS